MIDEPLRSSRIGLRNVLESPPKSIFLFSIFFTYGKYYTRQKKLNLFSACISTVDVN